MVSQSVQEICCCMGQPVAGNPTQYMMEQCFAKAGLDWRYLTLEVAPDGLSDAIAGMRAMGFRGGNLTTTHKQAVLPLLDEITNAARLIGRANCINRQGDQLIGENTDGKGLLLSLSGVIAPEGLRVAVLGAGGVARAVAVELALAGAAEITIVNRTESRGRSLADTLSQETGAESRYAPLDGDYEVSGEVDLLVNGTSIGLFRPEARVPVDVKSLRKGLVVADVVFSPPTTRLLIDAREHGCTTVDGLTILVNQARYCFKMWTNVEADATVMRDSLEEFLGL